MSLPFVPLDSSNERQHRTVIATATNELIKVRPPNDRTEAEVAAGVTPLNPAYSAEIDLRRHGLDSSATGATNRVAIERATDVSGELGGAIQKANAGTFTLDATTAVDQNVTIIEGQGQDATVWRFDPSSADVCFDFTRGASSIVRSGIRNCGFFSNNTTTKTAIQISDGRQCSIERIAINEDSWPGSGSIGIRTYGRDFLQISYCDIECARPIVVSNNPNNSVLHVDMCYVDNCQLYATLSTGKCVEVESGVEMTNWRWENVNFAGGKYGFFWDDAATSQASYNVSFINCRTEQNADPTGFSYYIASSSQRLQDLYFESCKMDPANGGIYARNCDRITIKNTTFTGGAGTTALDITFNTQTVLVLENVHIPAGATVTLTNAVLVWAAPFNPSETAVSKYAVYRYNEGATNSQRPEFWYNQTKHWSYQGTLANSGTFNTPLTVSNSTAAIVEVCAHSATGPISCGGTARWTKGNGTAGSLTKIGGDSTFVVSAVGTPELRLLDNGSGNLVLSNALGQTITFVIDITYV